MNAFDIGEDLKNEVWVLVYIINDAMNLMAKLGLIDEFVKDMNPYLKPTFNKVVLLLNKIIELREENERKNNKQDEPMNDLDKLLGDL